MTVAYIRHEGVWKQSTDRSEILSVPAEDLVFSDGLTLEEVEQEIQSRRPVSIPGLHSVCIGQGRNDRGCIIECEEYYRGDSLEEAIDIAKQVAPLSIRAIICTSDRLRYLHPNDKDLLTSSGCRLETGFSFNHKWVSHIKYDPVAVEKEEVRKQKARIAREKRSKSSNVFPRKLGRAINSCLWMAHRHITEVAAFDMRFGQSYSEQTASIAYSLRLMDAVYGSRSYRKTTEWAELMEAWKECRKQAIEWFKKKKQYDSVAPVLRWFDHELKVPRSRKLAPKYQVTIKPILPKLYRGQK